ncbi:MAG TPA: hypothetical protein VK666_25800 [Chryseolinea sp.]|nr:hypothetical protein [Chryseolinea sp.]
MKRRTFIKQSSLTAISISALGMIQWNGKSFVGDSPTTTDILGPFYRPGAPMRSNIIPADSHGLPLTLKGTIFKEDGKTPLKALVEIWQCDENEHYDNTSDNYLLRGALNTEKNGKYEFKTIIPVPYKADQNDEASWRPAHIHMRVSVPNQQDLITQIYFKDGKYNDTDPWAATPEAVHRTLKIEKNSAGQDTVTFDVVMAKEFPLNNEVYKKITGIYQMDNGTAVEFSKNDDLLFMKRNGQLWAALRYVGNNTFEGGSSSPKVTFEILAKGGAKAVLTSGGKTSSGEKYLKYSE